MGLNQWSEKEIICFLEKTFKAPPGIIGIGDDCAVIPIDCDRNFLVTVDALAERIHFISSIHPNDLGYKSVMVNISDIVSMGGVPKYLFLSCALPSHFEKSWIFSFLDGIKQACDKTNTFLLGGDTIGSSKDLFISITAIGVAEKKYTKYRSQAKIGDIVCVTGQLGESPTGLKCILNDLNIQEEEIFHLVQSHLRPEAHVSEGIWLSKIPEVHAMTDISDGINQDLSNIIAASHCGAVVFLDTLPISTVAKNVCLLHGWNFENLALSGGEEYSLLVAIDSLKYSDINKRFKATFGRSLLPIGQITEEPCLKYKRNGLITEIHLENFNHSTISNNL